MFEAGRVQLYVQRTQHIHRIMANYMPLASCCGDLLA